MRLRRIHAFAFGFFALAAFSLQCGDSGKDSEFGHLDAGNDAPVNSGSTGFVPVGCDGPCAPDDDGGPIVPHCGDGTLAKTESCDDGNNAPNDGCSPACALEAGYTCPTPGLACVAAKCGDGILVGTEECEFTGAPPTGCSADCKITAPDVSLGNAPLASQFSMVTKAVLKDCSKGSSYQVSFTAGGNNGARPWRAMSDGSGHSLQYNIYLPDGVTIWDQTNPQANQANAGKGTGLVSPAQQQTFKIGVNPAQTTPPAGHYTDTVSVVLSF